MTNNTHKNTQRVNPSIVSLLFKTHGKTREAREVSTDVDCMSLNFSVVDTRIARRIRVVNDKQYANIESCTFAEKSGYTITRGVYALTDCKTAIQFVTLLS